MGVFNTNKKNHRFRELKWVYGTIVSLLIILVSGGVGFAQPTYETTGISYTNNSGADTTGIVWTTASAIAANCNGDFIVEYVLGGTGAAYASVEYNTGSGWAPIASGGSTATGTQIELRLVVTNLPNTNDVTLNNVVAYESIKVALVSVNTHDVSCYGGNDGAIEIVAHCGSQSGVFTYTWTGLAGTYSNTGSSITNLEAGDYSCTVSNGNVVEDVIFPYTVNEPLAALTLSINLIQDYSCPSPVPGCNGQIGFILSGGTTPYKDTVVYTSALFASGYSAYSGALDALCANFYYAVVTDQNDCTVTSDTVQITEDSDNPTLTAFPYDYFKDYATFASWPQKLDSLDFSFSAYQYTNGSIQSDTAEYIINAQNYQDLELKLIGRQASGNWDNNDFIKIRIDYGSGYSDLTLDYSEFIGLNPLPDAVGEGSVTVTQSSRTTGWLSISSGDGNPALKVQVICNSAASERIYNIDNVYVRGNSITSVLTSTRTVEPGCDDLHGCSVGYTDSDVTWVCTTPGAQEFYFTRTWKATDGCGKESAPRDQIVSIGERPYFSTALRDTIFDFCYNSSDVPCVAVGDDCGNVAVSWVITDEAITDTLASGNGTTVTGVTFPLPVLMADTVFTIHWNLIDDAYITQSGTQNVSIKPAMYVSCTPDVYDFCSLENASFSISVSGGTGTYEALVPGTSITPNGTWNNGAGSYSTSLLDLNGVTQIDVQFTDSNTATVNGGCTSGTFTFHGTGTTPNFEIHQLIQTNAITRDP